MTLISYSIRQVVVERAMNRCEYAVFRKSHKWRRFRSIT
jgi:hypothetical protein